MQFVIQRNANGMCDHFLASKFWKNSGHATEKIWSHKLYIWL